MSLNGISASSVKRCYLFRNIFWKLHSSLIIVIRVFFLTFTHFTQKICLPFLAENFHTITVATVALTIFVYSFV